MSRSTVIFVAAALLSLAVAVPVASYASTTVNVTIKPGAATLGKNAFNPDSANISVGDTVTWIHDDKGVPHHIVSGNGNTTTQTGVFDSGVMHFGNTYSFTFNNPGTYYYYCSIHPSMQGVVTATMFVLPESPVGMAALLGSSAAVLGAFVLLRQWRSHHNKSPASDSLETADV